MVTLHATPLPLSKKKKNPKGGRGVEREKERERGGGWREREGGREGERDSVTVYPEDNGFRPWFNFSTGPR